VSGLDMQDSERRCAAVADRAVLAEAESTEAAGPPIDADHIVTAAILTKQVIFSYCISP